MDLPPVLKHLSEQLRSRKAGQSRPFHLLLGEQPGSEIREESYLALAGLIQQGHFKTILTTGRVYPLEQLLKTLSVSFSLLIATRDGDERITRALDDLQRGVNIVVLPIFSQEEAFDWPSNRLLYSLERYFNLDIIIVGAIRRDSYITQALHSNQDRSIYYILSMQARSDDYVLKVMQEQHILNDDYLITDPTYGKLETFFRYLEQQSDERQELAAGPQVVPQTLSPSFAPFHEQQTRNAQAAPAKKSGVSTVEGHNSKRSNGRLLADILLVTVTPVEADALLAHFPQRLTKVIGDRTYYDLGVTGGAKVYMVQSQMGSGGPGGSHATVSEAIRALWPSAVIMLGIAFGTNPKKQALGDILVAHKLINYEHQRIGTGPDNRLQSTLRGSRVDVSVRLFDKFSAAQHTWQAPPHIHFGAILSGEKLVDHREFRDLLLQYGSDAIGGEMEGTGLYDAASRYKVDWILVKAISDWGDGGKQHDNEPQRQRQAAANAAALTLYVLERGGLALKRRRRKG